LLPSDAATLHASATPPADALCVGVADVATILALRN
jgi:hypothetical protein